MSEQKYVKLFEEFVNEMYSTEAGAMMVKVEKELDRELTDKERSEVAKLVDVHEETDPEYIANYIKDEYGE